DQGVDVVELDVLREKEGKLVVAHDHHDALLRKPMELAEALDLFLEPPLDEVEIDCDLKLPGREAELAGALAGRGLVERAMVSTREVESLLRLRQLEPDLRLGWTYPKTRRDWTRYPWAAPALKAALSAIRRVFPSILAKRGPELGIHAVWAYHPIVTPRLVEVSRGIGVEPIAWTVDDPARIAALVDMGVEGLCTDDPRRWGQVDRLGGRAAAASARPA